MAVYVKSLSDPGSRLVLRAAPSEPSAALERDSEGRR